MSIVYGKLVGTLHATSLRIQTFNISMRDLLGGMQDIRVEEVELSKDEQYIN